MSRCADFEVWGGRISQDIKSEIELMASLRHPNVIQLLEVRPPGPTPSHGGWVGGEGGGVCCGGRVCAPAPPHTWWVAVKVVAVVCCGGAV